MNKSIKTKLSIKKGVKCRKLTINIKKTWGDQFYTGLAGIQVIGSNQKVIELKSFNIDAIPKDLNSI